MQKTIDPYGNSETVSLAEFVKEGQEYPVYIRLIPDIDNRDIHLFRHESRDSDTMLKTVIDAKFSVRWPKEWQYGKEFHHLNFHDSDGEILLTFLNSLKWDSSRSNATVSVEYWPENNSEFMEQNGLIHESIFFTYGTESGKSHKVEIDTVFAERQYRDMQGKPVSSLAQWK